MSAAVIVMRPRPRRVATVPSKAPLVGRVRLAALRRATKAWSRVRISFDHTTGRPTAEGDRRAAIGLALGALNRMVDVWDTEEGRAIANVCYQLADVPRHYREPLYRGPAEVIDLAEARARRGAR